jgi:hypothetical protein
VNLLLVNWVRASLAVMVILAIQNIYFFILVTSF